MLETAGRAMSVSVDKSTFDEMLNALSEVPSLSDIYVSSGSQLFVKAAKQCYRLSTKRLSVRETEYLLNEMYGENTATEILRGNELDASYEIIANKSGRLRFRLNAVAQATPRGWAGINVAMRLMNAEIPTVEDLGIDDDIIQNAFPANGLVVIAGATNQGKSTTLAALYRYYLESPDHQGVIRTYEAPIEYVYHDIQGINTQIFQSDIPLHIKSFERAIRSALRGSPEVILVGEARDKETLAASCNAAVTGHCVHTTVHASSVDEVMTRMMAQLQGAGSETAQTNLLTAASMFVAQRLVPTVSGGLTALREVVLFDDTLRRELANAPITKYAQIVREACEAGGRTMQAEADKALEAGLISQATARAIHRERQIDVAV